MAEPSVTLTPEVAVVGPGDQTQVTVTIVNRSQIVEGYEIDVLGEGPQDWGEAVPAHVTVYPQQDATAVVVFSPPSGSAAPSGTYPFAVRVRSTEDPEGSAVVEGDLEIHKVVGLHAKIIPVTSTGRWRGRHVVQFSNWGNAPAKLRLVASDPDAALGFYLRPEVVELPLGGSATVRLSVRTRKPFLRGSPVRLPFQVVGEPVGASSRSPKQIPYGEPDRPVADGALTQKPILSRFAITALAVLLIGGIVLGVWLARTQPSAGETTLTDVGVPPTPGSVKAEATAPDTITVSWGQVARINGYAILPVEKDKPGTIGKATEADALQRKGEVRGLGPDEEYCFRVVSKRAEVSSLPSAQVCERTPKAKVSPAPSTSAPSERPTAGPSSAGRTEAPSKGPRLPPPRLPQGKSTGNPPTTEPPDQKTATPEPSRSPETASPGGERIARGTWVLGCTPAFTRADPRLKRSVEALTEAGLPSPRIISKQQYPLLRHYLGGPLPDSLLLAAVGPYPTFDRARSDAAAAEKATGSNCFEYQPEP